MVERRKKSGREGERVETAENAFSAVLDSGGSELWPDVAISPGKHLAEILEALEMSQSELARRMGRPVQVVNEIVRAVKSITPATALQLERVLGISGATWVRLEASYQYNKVRLASIKRAKYRTAVPAGGDEDQATRAKAARRRHT